MKSYIIKPCSSFVGEIALPGDKSIAHRALIIGALATGTTTIRNIPANDDCLSTIKSLQGFGVKITRKQVSSPSGMSLTVTVRGAGLSGLKAPRDEIFAGESGTTLRLLAGVAAGQPFRVEFDAGMSLSRRPMARITQPLRLMGARITGCGPAHSLAEEEYPPLVIQGGKLRGISYTLPVASAQVKSAILLAGLNAQGKTIVSEPYKTRDHTERMLKAFGANIVTAGKTIILRGGGPLVSPRSIVVPGDISSASFFMVLAAILPKARCTIKRVGLNPGRAGIIRVLKRMGADITVTADRMTRKVFEPTGTVVVRNSRLKGIYIKKADVPCIIDELPVLMVAASFASGRSVFEGVNELRLKETDRICSMTANLKAMGGSIRSSFLTGGESVEVEGGRPLSGAVARSFGDHRTAMSMVVAALAANGPTTLDDVTCINKSFPGFLSVVRKMAGHS